MPQKLLYFIWLLLPSLLPSRACAQGDLRDIDRQIRRINVPENTTPAELSRQLCAPYETELQKVRAIYSWISHHIAYSDTTVSNNWLGTPENAIQQHADKVLINRSAVCEGYANLYVALCKNAGITAAAVYGKVKENDGSIPNIGHAWVAVLVDGVWWLSDPTWGAGTVSARTNRFIPAPNDTYFLIEPAAFLADHFPDDPMWQLSDNPISEQTFRNSSAEEIEASFHEQGSPAFSARDTIQNWLQLDSTARQLNTSRRILRFNPANDLARLRLGFYFYNQTYWAERDILEYLAETLYDQKALADSLLLFNRIKELRQLYGYSQQYLQEIRKTEWRARVNEMPRPEKMEGAFQHLQGLYNLWLVCHYAQGDHHSRSELAAELSDHGEPGLQCFEKALQSLQPNDQDERLIWQTNKARMLFELGKSYYNLNLPQNDSPTKILRSNLSGLDLAGSYCIRMHALDDSLDRSRIVFKMSSDLGFLKEYYPLMAKIESAKGMAKIYLLDRRFEKERNQPNALRLSNVSNIISEYELCAPHFKLARRYQHDNTKTEETKTLDALLDNIEYFYYCVLGDWQYNATLNEYNSDLREAALQQKKTLLRKGCDKALGYYDQAQQIIPPGNDENSRVLQSKIRQLKMIR